MQPNDSIFTKTLDEYCEIVNKRIDELVALIDDEQGIVREAMRYSITAKGKRIRPVLVLEFCKLFGGDVNSAVDFAVAVEMIHCYSLIHDDLPCMDDDDLRRGKPSCHIKFGEANALLAGDALLTLAFNTISNAKNQSATSQIKAIRALSEYAGINGMIGGQVIDLKYEGQQFSEDILNQIHLLKTAALLSSACELGAISASASQDNVNLACEYGKYLGLAFQIIDDILDVIGTEEELGKPIGSDQESEKCTFITLYGLDKAKELADEYTSKAKQIIEKFDNCDFLLALTDLLLDRKS